MSLRATLVLAAAALALAGSAAPGCSSDAATTGDEENVVPADAKTLFEGAAVCDQTLKRHASVRETDLKEGTLRWACADVEGVTTDDDPRSGRGQEYCEYHAVHGGKKVTKVADVDTSKPLHCYFTSVYYDVDGNSTPGAKDAKLAAELSKAENLGVTVDPELVRMKISINSRNAATMLIDDCEDIAPSVDEERQVACYQASLVKNGEKLQAICRGQDLSEDSRWKRAQDLGAKVLEEGEAGFDAQRDIIGCLSLHRAKNGGATYRNSDPMICARIYRAKQECGCSWDALPAGLDGFQFTGWTADVAPVGCQRVKVDGEDYRHLTICKVPEAEAAELELDLDYSEDLQKFCNDRFGKDLVMMAPLRAVEVPGSCRTDTAFCSAFAAPAQTSGGATTTTTTGATTGGGSTSGGAGGGGGSTCAHDECAAGPKLDLACSDCAAAVCAVDSFCCDNEWDATCVGLVADNCTKTCN